MTTRPCARAYEIPYQSDSCTYFERIRHLGCPILLDSNAQATAGRFDILSAAPAKLISSLALAKSLPFDQQTIDLAALEPNSNNSDLITSLFAPVSAAIKQLTTETQPFRDLPFISGAIGVFSYDLGMRLNNINTKQPSSESTQSPKQQNHQARWPELYIGIYQWALIQDHQQKKAWMLADPKQAQSTSDLLLALLTDSSGEANSGSQTASSDPAFQLRNNWQANTSAEQYKTLFDKTMDYIRGGDCYQINLAQQMRTQYSGDPWQAYKTLRKTAPTPFAAYIELANNGSSALASLSPERFIQVQGLEVTTQPIKGTRKRGSSKQEDVKLMAELSGSAKDRAENLMIVDLMRNDLGKCCDIGSIKVPALFQIETHPNVHHLVSTISGSLPKAGVDSSLELLTSCLPGGSVTGAPKNRAMEIIDELEDFQRSIYCGSIAYISNNGDMDSNILIRSVLFSANKQNQQEQKAQGGDVYCWGGGGIVADSDAESEYEESLQKIRNILDALADLA